MMEKSGSPEDAIVVPTPEVPVQETMEPRASSGKPKNRSKDTARGQMAERRWEMIMADKDWLPWRPLPGKTFLYRIKKYISRRNDILGALDECMIRPDSPMLMAQVGPQSVAHLKRRQVRGGLRGFFHPSLPIGKTVKVILALWGKTETHGYGFQVWEWDVESEPLENLKGIRQDEWFCIGVVSGRGKILWGDPWFLRPCPPALLERARKDYEKWLEKQPADVRRKILEKEKKFNARLNTWRETGRA